EVQARGLSHRGLGGDPDPLKCPRHPAGNKSRKAGLGMPSSAPRNSALINTLNLWEHQTEALRRMRAYISAFRNRETQGAALVHMPTGTGKTRVIASLARYAPEASCSLVLAPRVALKRQLLERLEDRFFKPGVRQPKALPKRILPLEKKHL